MWVNYQFFPTPTWVIVPILTAGLIWYILKIHDLAGQAQRAIEMDNENGVKPR